MKLSSFAKNTWMPIGGIGGVLVVACLFYTYWITGVVVLVVTLALLAFFRDPFRVTPTQRGQMIAPADGKVSSIHRVKECEAFDGPGVCIRIFMSVFDVHVNRSPCHGRVVSVTHKAGKHINVLKVESAELNESVTMVLEHPTRKEPVCVVKQIAGAIARRIVCSVSDGDILQRGQRFGIIKFGSTVELYLPEPDEVNVQVKQGDRVYGGATVVAAVGGESRSVLTEVLEDQAGDEKAD